MSCSLVRAVPNLSSILQVSRLSLSLKALLPQSFVGTVDRSESRKQQCGLVVQMFGKKSDPLTMEKAPGNGNHMRKVKVVE